MVYFRKLQLALHSVVLYLVIDFCKYCIFSCFSTNKDGASTATKELDNLMASLSCLTTLVCNYCLIIWLNDVEV